MPEFPVRGSPLSLIGMSGLFASNKDLCRIAELHVNSTGAHHETYPFCSGPFALATASLQGCFGPIGPLIGQASAKARLRCLKWSTVGAARRSRRRTSFRSTSPGLASQCRPEYRPQKHRRMCSRPIPEMIYPPSHTNACFKAFRQVRVPSQINPRNPMPPVCTGRRNDPDGKGPTAAEFTSRMVHASLHEGLLLLRQVSLT